MSDPKRAAPDADRLGIDAEQMRGIGYRTVDRLVAALADPAGRPPLRVATPADLRARLSGGPPARGEDFGAILAGLEEHVLPFAAHWGHPGYFAFIPRRGYVPRRPRDLIPSALNVDAGSWTWGSGPSHLEQLVLDWFREWIGYPRGAAGMLVSGGSAIDRVLQEDWYGTAIDDCSCLPALRLSSS